MKDTVLVGLVAVIFSVSQLCTGNAIIPQASQSEGPTHGEDVSDLLQNLLPSSEDHVLQLPFGQESQSPGSDVIMRVLTAVNKQLVANRKVHDDDVVTMNGRISQLSHEVRITRDKMANVNEQLVAHRELYLDDNVRLVSIISQLSSDVVEIKDKLAALGATTAAETTSTGTSIPDRPPEYEEGMDKYYAYEDETAADTLYTKCLKFYGYSPFNRLEAEYSCRMYK